MRHPFTDEELEAAFWAKVDKNGPVPALRPELGPCWLWTASLAGRGVYGGFHIYGRKVRAHRWIYERIHGPLPLGYVPDHLCRVEACVNPAHLEGVTESENVRRGHAFRARPTHCAKEHELTESNSYPASNGSRRCKICWLAYMQLRRRNRQ